MTNIPDHSHSMLMNRCGYRKKAKRVLYQESSNVELSYIVYVEGKEVQRHADHLWSKVEKSVELDEDIISPQLTSDIVILVVTQPTVTVSVIKPVLLEKIYKPGTSQVAIVVEKPKQLPKAPVVSPSSQNTSILWCYKSKLPNASGKTTRNAQEDRDKFYQSVTDIYQNVTDTIVKALAAFAEFLFLTWFTIFNLYLFLFCFCVF